MELNRERVVKALECCADGTSEACMECPLRLLPYPTCRTVFARDALALIREQAEENERLRAELSDALNKQVDLLKEKTKLELFDLVAARSEAEIYKKLYLECRADTVRKMQERLKDGLNETEHTHATSYLFWLIDQIAKELSEEGK